MPRRWVYFAGAALALAGALAARPARAALLANFAESQVLYEQCVMSLADHDGDGDTDGFDVLKWQRGVGMMGQTNNSNGDSDRNGAVNGIDLPVWRNKYGTSGGLAPSTCWKLYLDPEGIVDGVVTAFVEAPAPGPGEVRFLAEGTNGLFQIHPEYDVRVLTTNVLQFPGRQRIEAQIRFTAKNPLNPPSGPVTLFGYQVGDMIPGFGLQGVQTGFTFQGGGFVETFDTTTNQTTFLSGPQLPDVLLPTQRALLAATDPILAIDVDPPSSRSNYPPGQGAINAGDLNPNTRYVNQGKRNSGFITHGQGNPTLVQSMQFVTSNGPEVGDPTSWELYGTTSPIASPDNSPGNVEAWTLIASGGVNLPAERGAAGPVLELFNMTPYTDYRIVFPTLKDFRAASAMEIAEVRLFQQPGGMGQNFMPFLTQVLGDPRAIHLPTPEADSPPNQGAPALLDGAPYTKYRNFGRENSGFIVTPTAGPTIVESFRITTADDVVGRDPTSWALFGTNDAILSQDFSNGNTEAWTLIGAGTLALPDARLEEGPLVQVNNFTPYLSYRLVFPSVKNAAAPGVDSVQIGDIQFYGPAMFSAEPAPEPGSLGLALLGAAAMRNAKRRLQPRARPGGSVTLCVNASKQPPARGRG